jgi:hypothetical protein
MTLAERYVDWTRTQRHIDDRRRVVERAGSGVTRRIATSLALAGHVRESDRTELAARLEQSLDVTARFGYRSAQAEIRSMRGETVTLAFKLPDVGSQSDASIGGLAEVQRLVRRRAREAADRVVTAALASYAAARQADDKQSVILAASRRALHRVVIELVGETLAQGRSAGALAARGGPPEFAQRSSMLDKNSCEPCDRLNGTIVQVGSADYFDNMPPSFCLGGGRCRCVYVFGDTAAQVERPAAA